MQLKRLTDAAHAANLATLFHASFALAHVLCLMSRLPADTFLSRLKRLEPTDARAMLRLVVDYVRPAGVPLEQCDEAFIARVHALAGMLQAEPELAEQLRKALGKWLAEQNVQMALSHVGVLPRRGFMQEMHRRWYDTINPPPANVRELADTLRFVFHRRSDYQWVEVVSDAGWYELLGLLFDEQAPAAERLAGNDWMRQLLDTLEKLSIWVAAEELESDLVRLDPKVLDRQSPFSALQREMAAFVADYQAFLAGQRDEYHDDAHLRVLLDQSVSALVQYRKRSLAAGASIGLTYLLERLEQTLARIATILDVVDLTPATRERARTASVRLFRELVAGAVQQNSLHALWKQNIGLLARNVSNNASEHGGHYASADRKGYLKMFRAAAGAGLVIPFMAIIKLWIGAQGFPVLIEHILYSLDYGLGFVLIHILGFAVATKQPAMTAALISASMEREGKASAAPAALVELFSRVSRTQFIAIIGNVSVALLLAWLIAQAWPLLFGAPVIGAREAEYVLASLHPFAGLALAHAAIAGIWLFLSGLIAGYFDNRFVVLSLRERFEQHPFWRWLLPDGLRHRFGGWLAENYGSLYGNFLFGVMLGMTGLVGFLVGLPIDIRHVAFSAANVGLVSLPSVWDTLLYLSFALLVGFVNLVVSFSLALFVGLRARGLRLNNPLAIARAMWGKLTVAPTEFFLPPGNAPAAKAADAPVKVVKPSPAVATEGKAVGDVKFVDAVPKNHPGVAQAEGGASKGGSKGSAV